MAQPRTREKSSSESRPDGVKLLASPRLVDAVSIGPTTKQLPHSKTLLVVASTPLLNWILNF